MRDKRKAGPPKGGTAVDMTRGNPYRLYIRYAIPLLLGNILQQLYNLVDTIVVGNVLGETSLAAVGSGFPFLFLVTAVFIGIGLGAMILVAQLAGRKDEENLQRLLGTIYRMVLVVAVPLTVLGVVFAGPVLSLLQVQETETLRQGTLYMQIVFLGLLGTFGFNINAGFLQGLGDSMSSLLFLTLSTILNIVLDLVLTMVVPLGVLGVAVATSFSQTFSWVFGIFYINRRYTYLHIHLWRMPFDRQLLARSIQLGLPGAIQQFLYAVGNMVVQALVNRQGSDFTAGFVAANKVDTFVFLPILSMQTAITTYVGQNVGCRNWPRIRMGTRAGLLLMGVVAVAISAVIWLLRVPSIALFNRKAEVIGAGVLYLEAVLPFYVLLALFYGFNAIFLGAGKTYPPMIGSVLSLCLARMLFAIGFTQWGGADCLYYAYPASWCIGLLFSGLYFWKGSWRRSVFQDTLTGRSLPPL